MKRTFIAACGTALALMLANSAHAQKGALFLAGSAGASIPMGEFKDNGAGTGWMARGGLGYDITNNVFVAALVSFGRNNNEAVSINATLAGAAGTIGYSFGGPTSTLSPYVRGTFGVLSNNLTDIHTDAIRDDFAPVFGAAAGIFRPMGQTGLFVEASYDVREKTQLLILSAGLRVTLRGGK